jgi:hypothetical protein
LEKIYESKPHDPPKKLTGLIKTILSCSNEDILASLGPFGIKLSVFASHISSESPHPDIFSIFDGELVSEVEGSFSRDVGDVLKLVSQQGRQWISAAVLDNLKKFVTKHKSYEILSQAIDDPCKNLLHVRFLSLRNLIDDVRLNKRMQEVNTDLLYRRGFTFWMSEPSDFKSYTRGSCLYQSDIEEACIRHKHFSDLGLSLMATEIQGSVEKMRRESAESQHFGFNKISLTSASVILAKQCGYKYHARDPNSFDRDRILADADSFKYRFFSDHKDSLFDDSHFVTLEFSPRVYTYHELEPYASDETKDVVEHLERFPEAYGYPLFDHYRVLVPGVNYPESSQSVPYSIRLPNGTDFNHPILQKVQMRLDAELLQQKEIAGILLGEKDGDCYFISYF